MNILCINIPIHCLTTFEANICAAQPLLLYLIIVICVLVAVAPHKIAYQILKVK